MYLIIVANKGKGLLGKDSSSDDKSIIQGTNIQYIKLSGH